MYTQKLLVHDRSKWQSAKGIHTCFVDLLGVFVLTLQLESEVVCQVSTLVVSS